MLGQQCISNALDAAPVFNHKLHGFAVALINDPARFAEFRRRYKAELAERPEQLSALRAMVKGRAATLLTATRELDLSHAEVMRSILQRKGTAR